MKCPRCQAWSEVKESRQRDSGFTYRRYECANQHRFSTEERPVEVIKAIRQDDEQVGLLKGAIGADEKVSYMKLKVQAAQHMLGQYLKEMK